MITEGRVYALITQTQSFDRLFINNMRIDNFSHIVIPHPAVPDALGVDNYRRPMLALIQTAGSIGAYFRFQPAGR